MKKTAVAGIAAAQAERLAANPLGLPIGSQIWPTRTMLHDFPAYVKKMADIGVTRLELCSPVGYGPEFGVLANGREVAKILSDHGMKCESSHFTMEELRKKQDQSLAWAKDVGIKQVITATLGGGSHPTMDQVKKAADEYNHIAGISAKAGMQQGLHNEGFELSNVDGRRTYDILLELLDPGLVKFQFQMSTITAGFVAADYFNKYPGRFFSMHLQDVDLKKAHGDQANGRIPQVPIGQGSIDWIKTFTAAKTGGVKNYFVEQTWDLTKPSVAYLKTLKV